MPDRDTVEAEITQLLTFPLESMWQDRDFMRVTVARSAVDPEVGHVIGHHLHNARVQLTIEKLRRHQEAGRIRRDVDVAAVAHAIAGMNIAWGFFAQVVFAMDRDEVRSFATGMTAVLTRGIGTETAACTEEVKA